MPTLHLGVIDIPYVEPPSAPKKVRKAGRRPWPHKSQAAKYGNTTTGDVAGWLENRYHVMEIYYELHQAKIADDFANSVSGSLETFLMGGPANLDVMGTVASQIEDGFKQMLSGRELDSLGVPGIPTAAAQAGKSSRFKSGFNKTRSPRPSFIDTGLYQASFKAWVR
jgi:hypothetical protein